MLSSIANSLDLGVERIEFFGLTLVRVSTIIFTLPFLSMQSVTPTVVRTVLSFALALMIFPQLPPAPFVIENSVPFFFLLVLEQVMIGLMIGFASTFVFHFVVIGGHLIARDMGIAMGGTVNPIQDQTSDEVAVLISLVLSTMFLVHGNHFYFIRVLFDTFQVIPIGNFSWDMRSPAQIFTVMGAAAFFMGIKLAAPMMITLLVTSLGMALVARVMPQMNVWIVAVPLKVILGSVTLVYVFPLIALLFNQNFEELLRALEMMLRAGGRHG